MSDWLEDVIEKVLQNPNMDEDITTAQEIASAIRNEVRKRKPKRRRTWVSDDEIGNVPQISNKGYNQAITDYDKALGIED